MNRITVEMVKEAAEKTGLKLIRRDCGDGHTCGCPLMALKVAEEGSEEFTPLLWPWADDRFGADYVGGFLLGIDGGELPHRETRSEIALGYSDGLACAAAVFGEPSA